MLLKKILYKMQKVIEFFRQDAKNYQDFFICV